MIIVGVAPKTRPVSFAIDGYESVSGGVGGWETLDRPRNTTAAEWVGTPEKTLTLPLIIDGIERDGVGVDRSIATQIATVETWGLKHPTTGRPPLLSVIGSRHTTPSEQWVVQDVDWGEFEQDDDGRIVQQALTLNLLRFAEVALATGPAAKIRATKPTPAKSGKQSKHRKHRKKRK